MSGIKRIRQLLSGGVEDRSLRCKGRSRQATNEDCIVEVSDPTGRTLSSVPEAQVEPEQPSTSKTATKVWSLDECRILHELDKPIAIVLYDSQSTAKQTPQVLFQNVNCQKRFGLPRSQFDFLAVSGTLSDSAREAHDVWLQRIQQGVRTQQMDVYGLFRPLFQGISKEMPKSLVRIDSRPIQVQVAPEQIATAIMHVVALNWSHEDMRFKAMLQCNPFHSYMFNSQGTLLCASAAAIENGVCRTAGPRCDELTLGSLFVPAMYKDNVMGAQSAYDAAIHAVFEQQVECHRHVQTHVSSKTGKVKWTMMEMWPMLDPVDDSPAVLVTRYNITQHKELEHELVIRQSSLEQQKQDLEQATVIMQEEKDKLEEEAHNLAQKLEAVLHDKYVPREVFDADTPIDKTLKLLQTIIGGTQPTVQEALDLHYILSQSDTDLRQPVGLEEQLMADTRLGSAVGMSMLQLLQGDGVPIRKLSSAVTSESEELMLVPWVAGAARSAQRAVSLEQELQTLEGSDEGNEFMPYCIMPHIERLLQGAEKNWQYDIFALADATPGNTLSLLAFHLINRAGFITQFNLDEGKLCLFLQRIEAGYNAKNPYHNSIHVASVLQMVHMLLCHGGFLKTNAFMGTLHLSTYWSAIIHDFQHGGVNNDFLIKTAHPIALTYNDQSPLENHHLATAFQVLLDPECQYVRSDQAGIAPESARLGRTCAINQVLGTDMKKHFDIVSRFQAVFKRDHTSSSGAGTPHSSSSIADHHSECHSFKAEDQTLVHQMVLKCADIGHLAADLRTHKRWAYLLEEEFFSQGDRERKAGLPVSPLMDRAQPGGMVRSQLGFFSIVGIPMFKAMTDLFKDAQPMLDGVLANYHAWEKLATDAST